jgi:hypothetical protein
MNLKRKINIWIITYCSILALFGVIVILLAYFVDMQIKKSYQNNISDIPIYSDFDNEIKRNTYTLISQSYDEVVYLNGYVTDIIDLTYSEATLNINYAYYKIIEIGDVLVLTTLFGTVESEVVFISDTVLNGSVSLTVVFDNNELRLLNGSEVNSSILYKQHHMAIIIPNNFIYETGLLHYVYVLNDQQTEYHQVFVEIKFELTNENRSVIIGDIYVGDEIVEIR